MLRQKRQRQKEGIGFGCRGSVSGLKGHESRRCSRDTYLESSIAEYTSLYRKSRDAYAESSIAKYNSFSKRRLGRVPAPTPPPPEAE